MGFMRDRGRRNSRAIQTVSRRIPTIPSLCVPVSALRTFTPVGVQGQCFLDVGRGKGGGGVVSACDVRCILVFPHLSFWLPFCLSAPLCLWSPRSLMLARSRARVVVFSVSFWRALFLSFSPASSFSLRSLHINVHLTRSHSRARASRSCWS